MKKKRTQAKTRLARVTSVTGGLFLHFEGAANPSQKSYKHDALYTPVVDDRVSADYISGTYIVRGKVV